MAIVEWAACILEVPPNQIYEFGAPICLGETCHYFNQCDLFCSFHAIVDVQFGGLSRLDTTISNYKENINSCYCHADMTLSIERALRNIIVCVYMYCIDTLAMNGACVDHCAVLMRNMLNFALHLGQFRHWEKHCELPVPRKPRSIWVLASGCVRHFGRGHCTLTGRGRILLWLRWLGHWTWMWNDQRCRSMWWSGMQ